MSDGVNSGECLYTGEARITYLGDEVGVVCTLAKPRTSTSSKPKDHMNRIDFEVVTTSASFNLQALSDQIDHADQHGNSAATVAFLSAAKGRLEEFIGANGRINPAEAADWDGYYPSVSLKR